jgi:hypothetical protein
LPLEIIHLNTLPAVTSRKAGGLRSRRRRANDSRQQQLGGFVALARESAQLTTTYGFTGRSGSRRNPHVSTRT